ncbi:5-oxoprolinase subunit PxpA [Christiangramia sabulilitoris]|uniref:5-oxoprolinase subunit PxpA n=1 Tax=Christiangramia sabulilitoris TaxID=2583991 RepID=A0A550I2H9_9FLAO|nr:5-oxoprolinase subunit PxpA [Christiangramia sabulilitoris]TRO65192.1 5-oxoprolinase subunit PxpA [Christiangramia sabulilitoris]
MQNSIHINCDLGEGSDFDEQLMPLVSACNIACGGHAGNLETMHRTVRLAMEHKVEIGAHPSYPDRKNFGRNHLEMSHKDLRLSIEGQVLSLKQIAESEGAIMDHVKLHGALYNDAARDENIAKIIVECLQEFGDNFKLYVPLNSKISEFAMGKFDLVFEAFADRNYRQDYTLVPRGENHAVLSEKEKVFNHVFSMYKEGEIITVNGEKLPCNADTFCVHSDTKSSLEILNFLHKKFAEKGIRIKNA